MKTLLLSCLMLPGFVCCLAQTPKADSLKRLLATEGDLSGRFSLNRQIARDLVKQGKPDYAPPYLQELYSIATKEQNDSLLLESYLATAHYLDWKTDAKEALEYELKALAIAEEKYPSFLPRIYNALSSAYSDLQNYRESLKYSTRSVMLMDKVHFPGELKGNTYFQLAHAYYYLGMADSTLHYSQLANEVYIKEPDLHGQQLIWTLTANAYAKMGNYTLAESFYRSSNDKERYSDPFGDAYAAAAYSNFLLGQNKLQEAKYYGLKGLDAAITSQAKGPLLDNVATLRKVYEAARQPDSAYYYSKLELAYRDSLFNQQRLYAVQDMTFKEQVHQQEELIKAKEEHLQRQHNLQFILVGLGLVVFLILFFVFSHSIIANQKLIRFLGIIALLMVFEFLNLLLHPWLEVITHHSPFLMLLAMVCVAAFLIPVHHRLEHWVTHKLVEKNKRIKLAAAKKIIAKLEPEVE